jgi:protein tyrosine/serine phosphatase
MKIEKIIFLFIVVFLCELGCSQNESHNRLSKWAQPVESQYVKNLFKLTSDIYRSGQPNKDGFVELSKMGIKTILNLREYHADEDKADGTSLKTVHIKMDAGKIRDADVVEALNLISLSPKPLLIHCWHGSDRTGLICAMYRIIYQDWSKKEAIDELLNGGYGYHEMYENIPMYIKQVDIELIKKQLVNYKK